MKRLILTVLAVMLMCGGVAYGAGSANTLTFDIMNDTIVLTYTITADNADGSIPSASLPTDTETNTNGMTLGNYLKYNKYCIWEVRIFGNHGGTEVTENSEIYLYDSESLDLLGGQGVCW